MPRPNHPEQERDWYEILDVAPNADDAAIKAAHRKRARDAHPDVSGAIDATQRMAEINRARDVLLDRTARADFDRARLRARVTTPPTRPKQAAPRGSGLEGFARMKFSFGAEGTDGAARASRPTRPHTPPQRPKDPAAAAREAQRWRFDARAGPNQEDWYRFLGVYPWSTEAEVQAAVKLLVGQANAVSLSPAEKESRQAKLRLAWETLGKRHNRTAYDAARPPWEPQPGHQMDFYKFLGVRRGASNEELGAAVTQKSREIGDRPWNADLRSREALLREAWWILRDPTRRAAYDKALK